jgi:hypothetical protein
VRFSNHLVVVNFFDFYNSTTLETTREQSNDAEGTLYPVVRFANGAFSTSTDARICDGVVNWMAPSESGDMVASPLGRGNVRW